MERKIKLAVVGVGNCASSLIQGIEYYKDARDDEFIPGLMHANFGGYHIRDIEIVAAFDVNADKVGKDVAEAIYTAPNNTTVFAQVPPTGVLVQKGPRLDGVNKYTAELVPVDDAQEAVDVVAVLKAAGAEILVNYLPVGSQKAIEFYAECCLEAGVRLLNCMPVFIVSDPAWGKRFADGGHPLRRRRHQGPGRRDHPPPRADAPDPRPRRARSTPPTSSTPAATPTSSTCSTASAWPSKKISKTEAVQSQLDVPLPRRPGPHRPVRLRALAEGQQGLLPADRGARTSAACR